VQVRQRLRDIHDAIAIRADHILSAQSHEGIATYVRRGRVQAGAQPEFEQLAPGIVVDHATEGPELKSADGRCDGYLILARVPIDIDKANHLLAGRTRNTSNLDGSFHYVPRSVLALNSS